MKKWFNVENGMIALLVSLPILFNLYFLKPELGILSDVNDNVFAYALAVRMEKAWDDGHCPWNALTCLPKLTDHWVSYWAMGYPLPHYYQHLPSIVNVALFKIAAGLGVIPNTTTALESNTIVFNDQRLTANSYSLPGLFLVFNWTKYLLLSLFPLAIYWSARKFRFPKLAAAFSSLVATLISTNFQYGTDYGALIWRGSGMYTQLWGIVLLPLAVASIYDSITSKSADHKIFAENPESATMTTSEKKRLNASECFPENFRGQALNYWSTSAKHLIFPIPHLFRSVFLLFLTFESHVLFGYIAVLSSVLILACLLIKHLIVYKIEIKTKTDKIDKRSSTQRIIEVALGILNLLRRPLINLGIVLILAFLSLSYWLIPLILNDAYHAHSVWDELYKFNSFGAREVINRWFDGSIFDFGRFPVLTILVFVGFFYSVNRFLKLEIKNSLEIRNLKLEIEPSYVLFPLLLIFWTLMYFGRTTWGGLLDLLPASEGIHMHRFINGIHFAGIFLIGLGLYWLVEKSQILLQKGVNLLSLLQNLPENIDQNDVLSASGAAEFPSETSKGGRLPHFNSSPSAEGRGILEERNKNFNIKDYLQTAEKRSIKGKNYHSLGFALCTLIFALILLFPAIKERTVFLKENTNMIATFNKEYLKDWPDLAKILGKVRTLQKNPPAGGPGRIWAGRPGNWGRQFKVGNTEVYLALSVSGLDNLGFEPESWSPNTDLEQFFNDQKEEQYNLFNLRYIIAPPEQNFPAFAKKIESAGKYNLYMVKTSGNFDIVTSDLLIIGNKKNTINLSRLWLDSSWVKQKLHPTLTYNQRYQSSNYNNILTMTDWTTYKIPGAELEKSLLAANPFVALNTSRLASKPQAEILSQKAGNDFFEARIQAKETALLLVKTTFHPFWQASIKNPTSSFPALPAGRQALTSKFMVSPYFLGLKIPPGNYTVRLDYQTAPYKIVLLIISLITLLATPIIEIKERRIQNFRQEPCLPRSCAPRVRGRRPRREASILLGSR